MSISSRSRRSPGSLLRSRGAVLVSLLAIFCGGASAGSLVELAMDNPNTGAAGAISALVPQVDPRSLSGSAYASAAPGQCLTWSMNSSDRVTSFEAVECSQPHRFEVAGQISLVDNPEFGREAPFPSAASRALIGTERCMPMVNVYSRGRPLDPTGRFAATVIPPSQEGWQKGDRSVLCGIAATELDGRSATSTGSFSSTDQMRLWEPGTCLGFNREGLTGAPVECSLEHSIEIVSILAVSTMYPQAPEPPDARKQAEATGQACHLAGADYLGGAEELRRTTLISTLVNPISKLSWSTGSRRINCGIMKAREPGPFATLRGSARQQLIIDGAAPVAPTTTAIPPPGGIPTQPSTVPGRPGTP